MLNLFFSAIFKCNGPKALDPHSSYHVEPIEIKGHNGINLNLGTFIRSAQKSTKPRSGTEMVPIL